MDPERLRKILKAVEMGEMTADSAAEKLRSLPFKAFEDLGDVQVAEVSANASDSFAAVTVNAEVGTAQTLLRTAEGSVRRYLALATGDGLKLAARVDGILGRLPKVDWAAPYFRKLPAIQWYWPEPVRFSTASPKLRRCSLPPPSPGPVR